jgi:hypothetical protein
VHLLSHQHFYIHLILTMHVYHQCSGPKSVLVTLPIVVESRVQQLPHPKHKRFQLDTRLNLMK